ncbi:Ribosomal protein S18 acetylase RimI [Arboricoccus pini]|uniref:Ribosomal protein S18 acetylase RimI n=1 Tax=Arboricoccus pini TaxID=1963835 RepID=A0A212Q5J9_9PROT|nr:GNAT family N-acetyltransferase [Arboricoccus pini]SNB54619.1 Ribosomal protein S18 acetylase RimI [Arboricoccus pini]
MWRATAPTSDLVIRRARALDAAALAQVQVQSWRETYNGLMPQNFLDGLSVTAHERQWRRSLGARGWAFIAVWQGQIVGLASGGRCRASKIFSGELYVLYLLRSVQGRGIGRALFDATHFELARRGYADMMITVLADNPARGFYEHLGGELVGETQCMIGGTTLREVAYGWPA